MLIGRVKRSFGLMRRNGLTLWFALRHRDSPWYARVVALAGIVYALSPIDLIPDFLFGLGLLDDLIVLPAMFWLSSRCIPAAVLTDSRQRAEDWMQRRWSGAKRAALWLLAILLLLIVWFAVIAPRLSGQPLS